MRLFAAVSLLSLAVGCSDRSGPSRFYPSDERARTALEGALSAWQQGLPTGELPGAENPKVHLADTHRTPGQRLRAFAVQGVAPGDGPRVFTVKLTLANPEAELRARFVVVGIDPIWVFRQEDYDMLSHWDHPMTKKGESKATPSPK